MYHHYCASCHGLDGKGGGPAADALKARPTDLTKLAKQNGGNFPTDRVNNLISSDVEVRAHGSKEMPVWGVVLSTTIPRHSGEVHQRLYNLTHYVEGLQEK